MFTCVRISDVEYYLAEAAPGEGEASGQSTRDRAAYYLDNGTGEDAGVWWSPTGGQPMPLVARGSAVSPGAFRAMARGCDPRTGAALIQRTRTERTAGYDCQFAAPKSVSALWAAAPPGTRAHIERLHRAAVHRALDFAYRDGLIITRRGKGGAQDEPVRDCAAAEFIHRTSRAGDPQLHSHAVLLNVSVRTDGSTGSLDNARILKYQGALGAVYRAELAAGLERELGLAIVRDGRNFRVDGVPETITQMFSKRRHAIETAAAINGFTTARDRERARLAAVATRERKSDVPGVEALETRWAHEIHGAGCDGPALWANVRAVSERQDRAAFLADGLNIKTRRMKARKLAALAAITGLEKTEAVMERRHVLREAVERMQGIATADEALAEVETLVREGHLVRLPERDDIEDACYATPAMMETERRLLHGVLTRRGEKVFVPPQTVENAIRRRPTLSEEQAAVVRYALNRDGVVVIEGNAGTGKSFSLGGVADAVRDAGMHVHVVAPLHKAKDVARNDTMTGEDSAKTVQGFNNRLTNKRHREHIALTSRHCIIVDEAGMVGTGELEVLLRYAQAAGAKVILAGDTRQLQPVSAGAPMAAIARLCGTQRLVEIRRQKLDWQRAASRDFAMGRADRALEAYDRAGGVRLIAGRDAALAALARDWRDDVARNPEAAMAKPWEARLVVAGWNADVSALNIVLREAYRAAGRLQGDDVAVLAFTRGQHSALAKLTLATGDRLIFGESVTVNGVTVNNADMATVAAISPGADPVVRLRLDKGGVVEAPWSAFMGQRDANAPDGARHPKCQHAYAVTVHAAQGTTIDRCFVFNGRGMGTESAYVAMTRHREDARMYVDTARILDRLEARKGGGTMTISSLGKIDARDADEITPAPADGGIDEANVKAALLREVMRSEGKRNISDFAEDRRAWALGAEMRLEEPEPFAPTDAPAAAAEDTLAALKALVGKGALVPRAAAVVVTNADTGRAGSGPILNPVGTKAGAWLQRRMTARTQGPAYPFPRMAHVAALDAAFGGSTPDARRARSLWATMKDEVNAWLTKGLGLAREILAQFRADIRTEPVGAVFAHRNEYGFVSGFEHSDPLLSPRAPVGRMLFTQMGERENPAVIYAGESAIDVLSAYQADGQPARALLCAFGGDVKPEALDAFARLAARHARAGFLLAFGREVARQEIHADRNGSVAAPPTHARPAVGQVAAAIRTVAPEANIETRLLPAEFRSGNEILLPVSGLEGKSTGAAARPEARTEAPSAPPSPSTPPPDTSLAPASAPSPQPTPRPTPPGGPLPPKEIPAEEPPESQLERAIGQLVRAILMKGGGKDPLKRQAIWEATNAILKARPRLIDEDISRAFLERPEILAAAKTAAGRRDAAAALIAAQAQRLAADYAHEVVQRWAKLEGHYAAAVRGNNPGEIAKVTAGMEKLATWLRSHSNVEALLRRRGAEFGIEVDSRLNRAVRGEPWKELLASEPAPEPDQPEEDSGFRPRPR